MKKIFLCLIILLFISPVLGAGYLSAYDSNRVLLMHMNGTNGGNTFTDENGKTISVFSVTTLKNSENFGGAAANFIGGGYLTIPDSADFNYGSGAFTIIAWVNQTTVGSTGTLFCQATSAGANNANCIRISSGVPTFEDKTFGAGISSPAITTSGKHQIVVIKNTTTIVMYTDGKRGNEIDKTGISTYDGANVLTFGRYGDYTGEYLVGLLDEVAMYKGIAIPISELYPQNYEIAFPTSDTTPPDSIANLTNTTSSDTSITWQWVNPSGSLNTDYNYLYVLKDDNWIGNYSNSSTSATWTGLSQLTNYTFSSKTVDLLGNINLTWVNRTTQTEKTNIPPVVVPTAEPLAGDRWCGLQDLFYQHIESSDIAGYEQWINYPSGNAEVDENVSIKSSDNWVLIDSYVTPKDLPNVNLIQAGLRTYYIYLYVSSNAGTTIFNSTLYKRNLAGNETLIYSVESSDIDATSITLYTLPYVSPINLSLSNGDRLVSKLYYKTSHPTNIVAHFVYQGNSRASFVRSGYFVCPYVITPTATQGIMPNLSTTKFITPIANTSTTITWNFDNDGNITWASLDGYKISNFDTRILTYTAYNLLPESKHTLFIYYKGEYATNSTYTSKADLTTDAKIHNLIWLYLVFFIAIICILIGTKVPFIAFIGCGFTILGILLSLNNTLFGGLMFMCVFAAGIFTAFMGGE